MSTADEQGPIWDLFRDELQEYAEALGRDTLAWERSEDPAERDALLAALFRTAHSLKTGSAALGVEVVSAACHALEGILAAARSGSGPERAEFVRLLLLSADAMADSVARLDDGEESVWPRLVALVPELVGAHEGTPAMPQHLIHDSQEIGSDEFPSFATDASPPGGTFEPPDPDGTPPPMLTETGSYRLSGRSDGDSEVSGRSVRVSARRVDALLARSETVVRAAERLRRHAAEVGIVLDLLRQMQAAQGRGDERASVRLKTRITTIASAIEHDDAALRDARALHEELLHLKRLPFRRVAQRVERTVRDLVAGSGRQVELAVEGQEVEIERSVLESLADPLLHLLRNAIDHGIEPAQVRRECGKPPWGTVTVGAARDEGGVTITVADDGAGFDLAALRAAAVSRGLVVPDTDIGVAQLVFEPGLSTAASVTAISGRGVGLDVVRQRVESVHGTIEVRTEQGVGSAFEIRVPLAAEA